MRIYNTRIYSVTYWPGHKSFMSGQRVWQDRVWCGGHVREITSDDLDLIVRLEDGRPPKHQLRTTLHVAVEWLRAHPFNRAVVVPSAA